MTTPSEEKDMKQVPHCKCRLDTAWKECKEPEIFYCKLHKSAAPMLELLKEIYACGVNELDDEINMKIKHVLAALEGK